MTIISTRKLLPRAARAGVILSMLFFGTGRQQLSAHSDSSKGNIAPGLENVIFAPKPEYPYEARRSHITGSGVCVMTIDPGSGSVTSADMARSTGSPILDNAATSACRRWRFKPGTVSKFTTPISFTVTKDTKQKSDFASHAMELREKEIQAANSEVTSEHSTSQAKTVPDEKFTVGFSIPDFTISPDHRYGILVPDFDHYIWPTAKQPSAHQHNLVELQSGHVLTTIEAASGFIDKQHRMNHGEINPTRWSRDSSLLLWEIEGRWSPSALVLISLRDGAVWWQTDILKLAQEATLTRTAKAAPAKYAAAKQANKGNGSAFPDGFVVNVRVEGEPEHGVQGGPISLPLKVHAELTSNPKAIATIPQLDSQLDGQVGEDGKLIVTSFQLRDAPSPNALSTSWADFIDPAALPISESSTRSYGATVTLKGKITIHETEEAASGYILHSEYILHLEKPISVQSVTGNPVTETNVSEMQLLGDQILQDAARRPLDKIVVDVTGILGHGGPTNRVPVTLAVSALGFGVRDNPGVPLATLFPRVPLATPTASSADTAKRDGTLPVGNCPPERAEKTIAARSHAVVLLLQSGDTSGLSRFVHPKKGLRFLPWVGKNKEDRIFSAKQVAALVDNLTVYYWGEYDADAGPILMTWAQYRKHFVYDHDYINATEITLNTVKSRGSNVNHLTQSFPGAILVEYYIPSQPNRSNWGSLWLVWQKEGTSFYLRAIAHNEWGI